MTPAEIEAATANYIDGLGAETLSKAAAYTTGSHWLLLGGLITTAIVTFLIVRTGLLTRLENRFGPSSSLGVYLIGLVYMLLSALFTLPWTIYSEWWRETSYERTSHVLLPIFFILLYLLIRKAGRTWWIWSGGLVAAFISALLLISPILIEPIFNSYEPVPEGEVRIALEEMAIEAGIPTDRLFMFDGSRQSNNFTANVSGIGGSARIAISDVAIGNASLDEVKAVTGHEVGHYVLNHVWQAVGTLIALTIVSFFVTNLIFPAVSQAFRASPDLAAPSTLPVLVFIFALVQMLATPLLNANTRIGETQADQYSLETVNLPDALASALVKTAEYRYPRPSKLQEALFYTHPSVERRVRMAMEWKAQQENAGVATHN